MANRDFTDAAVSLAKSNGVRLINRNELIEMSLKLNPGSAPVRLPKEVMAKLPADNKVCDRCGKTMIHRKSTKGEFFGCSGFPKCRNIKPI